MHLSGSYTATSRLLEHVAYESFPKDAVRKVENRFRFPLIALIGVTDLRNYLHEAETEAIVKAREMGAGVEDIADALGLTRQAIYYRLKALGADPGTNGHELAVEAEKSGVVPDLDREEGSAT